MVENNIKSAIILEDDAIVSQHFKEIVEDTLNKINKNHELIFFDHGKVKSHFLRNGLWKDIDLHITRHLQKFKKMYYLCNRLFNYTIWCEKIT